MIVAQLVQNVYSRYIPTSAPALFAGQVLTRGNLPVTSTSGAQAALGVLQADVPAFITTPQVNGLVYNNPRTAAVATNGRLAIKVATGQVLTAGSSFGLFNGEAVVVGTGGTVAATTIANDVLVVDEVVRGADGFNYILVFFN
jgi:hypothetical protein